MRRLPIALLLIGLWGCPRPSDGSLRVVVNLRLPLASRCLRVVVRGDDGVERASGPMARKEVPLTVAVQREDFSEHVTVLARGYADAACEHLTVPEEGASPVDATFVPNQVSTVSLLVEARGLDADGDGDPAGSDCDDNNSWRHHDAGEHCASGIDWDCDQLVNCADRDCNGQSCVNSGTCSDGGCTSATSEVGLCDDGLDNDHDGAADCADTADCPTDTVCYKNGCTDGARCQGGVCAGGTPRVCNQAPVCFETPGTCLPDGGCLYTPNAGASCSDGSACTNSDRCQTDGGCAGTPKTCNGGQCLQNTGCEPSTGTCLYQPKGSASCNDNDNCTTSDSCQNDGGCSGTQVSCPDRACQVFASTCSTGGTCQYNNRPDGTACDGGTCQSGNCGAPSFPYTPSNFSLSQLPGGLKDVALSCGGDLEFDSSGAGTFVTWCSGANKPAPVVVTQPGGREVVLLGMSGLSLTGNTRLHVTGSRPVIFAVMGDAGISSGSGIYANGTVFDGGGAGAVDCQSSLQGPRPGSTNSQRGSGGGGAGFGTQGGRGGDTGNGAQGGDGGGVLAAANLSPLEGGCHGALGGHGTGTGGAGGPGGGGLQLSVGNILNVSGVLSTSGGGAAGTLSGSNGGGGGGSGGALLLEANELRISGWLTANGGGGASGSGSTTTGNGGQDGHVGDGNVALGGSGPTQIGGPGGDGCVAGTSAARGSNGDSSGGGGGGGGAGCGAIRLNAAKSCNTGGGKWSPVPTSNGASGCP